ncbi:MAG: class I SAM-dependent methyltransferase [Deltaproteobacteria bacterium]|nr:class I SAM-dependent methyltransferase [Deltaproteobacteria bacterium]MBW2412899.1 class I SAM-dependent methyltransferase [Deltaproteobacteria bacterium]
MARQGEDPGWTEVARLRAEVASRRSPQDLRALQVELLRLAGDPRGRRVLDLGCGGGALARRLAERGGDVTAVDPDPDAIEQARRDAAGLDPGDRLQFLRVDPADPESLPRGPFDLVVVHGAGLEAPLRNVVRCARRGGRVLIGARHPYSGTPSDDRPLQALFGSLREAGVRVVDVAEPAADENGERRFLALLAERPRRNRTRRPKAG